MKTVDTMPAKDTMPATAVTAGRRGAPIAVWVNMSSRSPAAIRWAAAEGRYRRAPLQAVTAWRSPRTQAGPGTSPPAMVPASGDELQAEAEHRLEEAVRAVLGEDHRVECRALRGTTVKALLAVAAGAQLLVLESPQLGDSNKAIRPSLIAPQVVYRSPCPVVLVPRAYRDHPGGWSR